MRSFVFSGRYHDDFRLAFDLLSQLLHHIGSNFRFAGFTYDDVGDFIFLNEIGKGFQHIVRPDHSQIGSVFQGLFIEILQSVAFF